MYLIKTATFFIASLAFVTWGYRELQSPKTVEAHESESADTATPTKSAAKPSINSILIMNQPSTLLQNAGLINPPVLSVRSISEPNGLNDNWNLANTGLPADVVIPLFENSEPEQIVYYTADGVNVIRPNQINPSTTRIGQSLFVGTTESVAKTAEERQKHAAEAESHSPEPAPDHGSSSPSAKDLSDPAQDAKKEDLPLPENAFRVVFFKPGKRDNGTKLVPANPSPISALQGPDYSFEPVSAADDEAQLRLLSTVLSLGHGGELMLKVAKEGYVKNEPGFDFAVYENALSVAGVGIIFQEFALIGVSDRPDENSFKWFDCRPEQQVLRGCIGAVPTSEGGDKFDLSDVGMDRISYIWIKDTGKNKNLPSKWPTEGADLDAVRLYHAYRPQ